MVKDHKSSKGSEGQPLLAGADTGHYNYNSRPFHDLPWLVSYIVVLLGSIAGGVYALLNRNRKFLELTSPDHLNDPASCVPPSDGRQLLERRGDGDGGLDALMQHGAMWLSITVVGSLCLAAAFLLMLKRSAAVLVGTAIGLQVFLPAAGASLLIANGMQSGGISLLILAALLVLLFVLWRDQVLMVTRLLGVAGHGLLSNISLVFASLGLQLALVLLALPLLAGIGLSITNGDVGFNSARAPSREASGQCLDEEGKPVMCCVWQVDSWVTPYVALGMMSILWTTFLAFEIKVFTVSGTIAQWYFAPVTLAHSAAPSGIARTSTALRHALGPSLGSLCLGSLVLSVMSILRQLLQKAREEAGRNFCMQILAMLLSFLFSVMEFLTKFATVSMAITGEAFLDSGKAAVSLLSRNAMNAFGVWWLPPLILQNCALVAAAAWGFTMWSVGSWQFGGAPSGADSAKALGVIAFLCGWALLAFFCALLLNVVDAVFFCFALDRDARRCTIVEVHEVMGMLPSVGPIVENPDGQYQYANPRSQTA